MKQTKQKDEEKKHQEDEEKKALRNRRWNLLKCTLLFLECQRPRKHCKI